MGQIDDFNLLKNRISAAMVNAPSGSVLAIKRLLSQADSLLLSDKGRPPGQDDPARRQAYAALLQQFAEVSDAVRASVASTSASQGAQPESVKDLRNYSLSAAYRSANPFNLGNVGTLVKNLEQPVVWPDAPRQSFAEVYQQADKQRSLQ